MAITKRPQPPTQADIERVIRKGGTPPKRGAEQPALVQLRLPRQLVEQIDAALKSRPVPPSRHTWLLEAIHEKLDRGKG